MFICYTNSMNTILPPAVGDKVSFPYHCTYPKPYDTVLTGRVTKIEGGKARILVRAERYSRAPRGAFSIPVEKLTIVQRGLIDPTQHSDKGLETLTQMGTVPSDWGLAEIKWFKKIVEIETWTPCPVCKGDGRVGTVDGKLVDGCTAWNRGASKTIKVCESCPRVRFTKIGRFYRTKDMLPQQPSYDRHHGAAHDLGYSEMNGLVPAKFKVEKRWGVVKWHKDTRFDSRFRMSWGATSGHRQCELCGKPIPSNRFVPIAAKDKNEIPHGAWVGEDCARKFFGIKKFKDDEVVQTPDEIGAEAA